MCEFCAKTANLKSINACVILMSCKKKKKTTWTALKIQKCKTSCTNIWKCLHTKYVTLKHSHPAPTRDSLHSKLPFSATCTVQPLSYARYSKTQSCHLWHHETLFPGQKGTLAWFNNAWNERHSWNPMTGVTSLICDYNVSNFCPFIYYNWCF